MRVLHIFAPNFKKRFGGPIFDWQYAFSQWNNPTVYHLVLDHDENKLFDASKAFDFELSSSQVMTSRVKRATWVYSLIFNLSRFRADYDIVHFHVLWWGSLLSAAWAKWQRIPTVYQSVLLDADTPGNILRERFGRLKVVLLKNFTCILAISEFLAQDYLRHGFKQGQVVTLMNSVDTSMFHPSNASEDKGRLRQKYGLPLSSTILFFVGSVIQRKGVDILVAAFIKLSQTFPDLYLLLVGPHNAQENPSLDKHWVVSLKQDLATADLASSTNFMGMVSDRQTLADLYRASDIFVFPSRKEGLGNVVLEAMASGLQIVVSDIPVLDRVICNGVNGIRVPLEDVAATASAIIRIIENPTMSTSIASAARINAVEKFSFSAWQAQLVEIYNRLIDRTEERVN